MSLTQRFRVVLGVQIALGVGIAILLVSLIRNQHELRRSQDVHHQASLLADELRQSSDDLTRMARTYVVTGDARFERDYWAILDIRNGKRARPVDYHRVYWDLALPGREPPRPTDRIISMQDLMATLGLTATERALLTRAQGNSDALARIEDIAFHAVKGQFADTTGGFTIHGDPDRPLATRLLNDSAYFEQKAAIMAPIDSFYVLLERRTAERVAMDERRSLRLLQSLGALLFTILGAFLYSFLTLQRQIAAREHSEQALRVSEERWKFALEGSGDGVWDWNLETGTAVFSPAWKRMLGFADHEIADRAEEWTTRVHPDDLPGVMATIQAHLDGTTAAAVVENRMRAADGTWRWVLGRGMVVARNPDGKPLRMVGTNTDITERKEAERTFQLMRTSLDSASDALFWMSPDGRIVQVNDAACRLLGYTRGELLALCVPDVDAHYNAVLWHAHFPALRTAGSLTFESEQRARNGALIPVEIVANYVRIGEDEFNCAFVRDITARKQAEATHRLESAALQAVANAVMITDRAGVIVWTNGAFTTITGFTTDEALGRTPGDLLRSGEHNLAFYQALWGTILAGDVWRGEMINRRKDGSRYIEEMTITPLKDPSGTISHFIAIKQDITQRRTLEAQLQQAQKMESVGLLAGGVAHDFNNMLGVILGTVDMAMEEVDATQPIHEELLEIRMAAVRSADLTRQLLAFARQQTIAPTVLDLNETVPGMLSMLQRLIGEDISLHWQPAASLWPVLMDRSQMDQILTNLCVNARHAIAGIGTLSIATANTHTDAAFCEAHTESVPGDYVMLRVRDTGSGMDAATQARIFEPFFSTRGVGEGTGLGLATVYGAVKQNHGFVTVSSALGEGTTFEIYLPRHKGAVTPARLSGPTATQLRGGETILLVEDEPALIRLVTKALEAQGYVVLTANSAANALRLATEHADTIHLLVSDVVMPGMNGRDLAARVQALRPAIKSLFMSGHTADVIAIRGLLSPEVEFIEKPFTPVALAAKVREVLDGH